MTARYLILGDEPEMALAERLVREGLSLVGQEALVEGRRTREASALRDELKRPGLRGVLVGPPFLREAARAATTLARDAQAAGVASSLRVDGDAVHGRDTLGAPAARLVRWLASGERPTLILGTGAAAEATLANLVGLSVHVAGRDAAQLSRFAAAWRVPILPWERAQDRISEFSLLVNATSVEEPVDLHGYDGRLFDFHHGPSRTPWDRHAEATGQPFAGGRDLLLGRTLSALQHWTGQLAPTARLRDVVQGNA